MNKMVCKFYGMAMWKPVEEEKDVKIAAKDRPVKNFGQFLQEEDGMGTVEIILIIVVLISLVIIFKRQLTSLVNSVFDKINDTAGSI